MARSVNRAATSPSTITKAPRDLFLEKMGSLFIGEEGKRTVGVGMSTRKGRGAGREIDWKHDDRVRNDAALGEPLMSNPRTMSITRSARRLSIPTPQWIGEEGEEEAGVLPAASTISGIPMANMPRLSKIDMETRNKFIKRSIINMEYNFISQKAQQSCATTADRARPYFIY